MQKRAKCSHMSYQVSLEIVNSAQAQLSLKLIRLLTDEDPLCTAMEQQLVRCKGCSLQNCLH